MNSWPESNWLLRISGVIRTEFQKQTTRWRFVSIRSVTIRIQWTLLNGITLGPRQTDYINQMISSTDTHFGWLAVLRLDTNHRKFDPTNRHLIKQIPMYSRWQSGNWHFRPSLISLYNVPLVWFHHLNKYFKINNVICWNVFQNLKWQRKIFQQKPKFCLFIIYYFV